MVPHFLQQLKFHLGQFETEARDEIERFLAHVEQHFQAPTAAVPGPVSTPAVEPAPVEQPPQAPAEQPQEPAPAAPAAESTPPAEEQNHG